MVEVCYQMVSNGSWRLNFVIDFNDWEVDKAINFLSILQKERVSNESDKFF